MPSLDDICSVTQLALTGQSSQRTPDLRWGISRREDTTGIFVFKVHVNVPPNPITGQVLGGEQAVRGEHGYIPIFRLNAGGCGRPSAQAAPSCLLCWLATGAGTRRSWPQARAPTLLPSSSSRLQARQCGEPPWASGAQKWWRGVHLPPPLTVPHPSSTFASPN